MNRRALRDSFILRFSFCIFRLVLRMRSTAHRVLRDGVFPFGHPRIKGCSPPPRGVSPARHVLHRRSNPRHPPYALISHPVYQLRLPASDVAFSLGGMAHWGQCPMGQCSETPRNFGSGTFNFQVAVAYLPSDIPRSAGHEDDGQTFPHPKKRKPRRYAARLT